MKAHRFHLVLAAAVLLSSTAGAQEAQRTNARWQAWYGCWSASRDSAYTQTTPRTVCMVPTSNADLVEVVALAEGRVVHRDSIDASGRTHMINADGCGGSQQSRWSDDGRRVFLKAMTTCDGALTKTTAVIVMTPFGEWLDVRSVETAGLTSVSVARYREVGMAANTPKEIFEAIRGYAPNIDAARLASGQPIPAAAVIEASTQLNSAVLEAWVTQSGLDFVTDSKSLQQLADAGVSGNVTDAMVTTEANSRDVYDRWAGAPFGRQAGESWEQGTGKRVIFSTWTNDPWGLGFGGWRYGRQYTRYAFGTDSWSWLYGPSWGFGSFGNGTRVGFTESNVGSMLPPTIVLHNDPTGTAARGRSEKADNTSNEPQTSTKDGILDKAVKAVTGGRAATSKPGPR